MNDPAIQTIATNADAAPYHKKPVLKLRQATVSVEAGKLEARELLAVERKAGATYKDPRKKLSRFVKTKKKIDKELDEDLWEYTQAEYSSALREAIANNSSLDVVAALLREDAVVDFGSALPEATSKWNSELTGLLLRHRGSQNIQTTLDASLDVALNESLAQSSARLAANKIAVLSDLTAVGANASAENFIRAVERQQEALIEILLRGKSPFGDVVLSDALLSAVQADNYNLVSMLLAYGANPETNNAISMRIAVARKSFKIAVALLAQSRGHRISVPPLNCCVKDVLASLPPTGDFPWLELLLLAGADPNIQELASRLRSAVLSQDQTTVQLLVSYGVPIALSNDNALEAAIALSDKGLIQALLKSKAVPSSISNLLPSLDNYFHDREDQIQVTQWLLDAGATGEGVDDALDGVVESVIATRGSEGMSILEKKHLRVLLRGLASVDREDGIVLQRAYLSQNLDLVQELCRQGPNPHTLSAILNLVCATDSQVGSAVTISAVKIILKCTPEQSSLHAVLLRAVRQTQPDLALIQLLLAHDVDVCSNDCIIIREALWKCDIETFQTIVSSVSQPTKLEVFFQQALPNLEKASVIDDICRSQAILDNALVFEAITTPIRYEVIDFLLSKGASVDYAGGCAMLEVCKKQAVRALDMMNGHASPHTRGYALLRVIESGLEKRLSMSKVLLQEGCNQTSVDTALVDVVISGSSLPCAGTDRLDVVELLLNHGASVDHDHGAALKATVAKLHNDILKSMLSRKPYHNTVDHVFGYARKHLELDCERYTTYSLLIAAGGGRFSELNDALVDIAQQNSQHSELRELLLDRGASVDYLDGEAIKASVTRLNGEFLRAALRKGPSAKTLNKAFSHARMCLKDDDARFEMYGILLASSSVKSAELNHALIDVARSKSQHTALWELLLSKGASPDADQGLPVISTIQQRNLVFLPMLLAHPTPQKSVLNKGLLAAMKLDPTPRNQAVELLLKAGASGTAVDDGLNLAVQERDSTLTDLLLSHHSRLGSKAVESIKFAAVSGDVNLLKRLLGKTNDTVIASKALDEMTTHGTVKRMASGRECACLLLDKGLEQECIDRALLSYLEAVISESYDNLFVGALLDHSADVNAFDGRYMQIAARLNNKALFLQLLAFEPTSETLTRALPSLFTSGMAGEDLEEILHACFSQKAKPSTDDRGVYEPLTYLALMNYPIEACVLRTLLAYGYDLHWRRQVAVGPETYQWEASALLYMLVEPTRPTMSFDVFKLIVQAQVDVNDADRLSRITPLMICASNNSIREVDLLLRNGAEVNLTDRSGKSALAHASENGHIDIVQRLSSAGASNNDGSLHEAARELHEPIVKYLVEVGHDVDYPSIMHEGRSALLETLLHAQLLASAERPQLERTLRTLLSAGADPKIKYDGKNALYCVLSNDRPFEVLSAWLATDEWKNLDAKYNWFNDEFGRCYSATEYLQRGPWQGNVSERGRLRDLLRFKRCIDRYFAWEGEQPVDAKNLPDHLEEIERMRRETREEQRFQLELDRERHNSKLRSDQEQHAMALQQDKERHQQLLGQQSAMAVARRTIADNENKAALEYERKLIQQRHAEKEHILQLDQRAHAEREKVTERMAEQQHQRQLRLINAQTDSDSKRNRLKLKEISAKQEMYRAASRAAIELKRTEDVANRRLLEWRNDTGRAWTIRDGDSD